MIGAMRVGLFDHFGWAVVVTADDDHEVVDRRRIELVEPGLSPAPVHYDAAGLDDRALLALIGEVRASIGRMARAAFADLADAVDEPISSLSMRVWPPDFPTDVETLRQSPWEARADAVMYRQELAEVARGLGWAVHGFEAKAVEAQARDRLGDRAGYVLDEVRDRLGAPWTKEHRQALAATVLAGDGP